VKLYFAGPLFTPYERAFIDDCAARLRAAGFDVFVPHESILATAQTTPAQVFEQDRDAIAGANALVALLDGPSVDDGTACEIGLFDGLAAGDPSKKGTVGLVTDFREALPSGRGLNLFVRGCIESRGEVCTSIEAALGVLERWRRELEGFQSGTEGREGG